MATVELKVNGTVHRIEVEAGQTLLGALRDQLALTGAKYGCGEGQCGACTVLLDGRAVRACQTPAASVGGAAITTIEGLAANGRLHPVQEAFAAAGALQCGYCTPGMIVAAVSLLDATPRPTRAQIVEALDAHLCRCGAYARIVQAIQLAAERMAKQTG